MSASVVEQVGRKLWDEGAGPMLRSDAELAATVLRCLPLSVLKGVARAGFSDGEVERFIIPQRTRRHRAERGQPLTVDESDRTVRLLRVQTIAEDVFDDHARAATWLRRPLGELGGETPLAIAQTEAGARVVEAILAKIAWGSAA